MRPESFKNILQKVPRPPSSPLTREIFMLPVPFETIEKVVWSLSDSKDCRGSFHVELLLDLL